MQNVNPDLPPSQPYDEGKMQTVVSCLVGSGKVVKAGIKLKFLIGGICWALNWKLSLAVVCKFHDFALFVMTHIINHVTFALEHFYETMLNLWGRISTCCAFLAAFSLRPGFKFVWTLTLQKLPLKGLLKFSRLPRSSGLSDQHSTNEEQTARLCLPGLPFLALIRLLKLIYWAADLFRNTARRKRKCSHRVCLRPEHFCTK